MRIELTGTQATCPPAARHLYVDDICRPAHDAAAGGGEALLLQESSSTEKVDPDGPFERIRRLVSWVATSVFALSFAVLLVLSATEHWQPGNPLITFCDRAWRISGALALILGTIPILRRFLVRAANLFGLSG